MSGILTRVSAIYPHCLTYAHAHRIESNPFQLNDSTFLFFRIAFSFNFFILVSFFKVFFKMAVHSSNEIVDIILVLGEAGQNYCRVERLYRNRYPFRWYLNAIQIRILLRERRRIRKRNRKQINADPLVLAVLAAMRNLNPHISTRKLQRNLKIPYVTVWRILQRHKFHSYHIAY